MRIRSYKTDGCSAGCGEAILGRYLCHHRNAGALEWVAVIGNVAERGPFVDPASTAIGGICEASG